MESPVFLNALSDELRQYWMRTLARQELKRIEPVRRRWQPFDLRQLKRVAIEKPARLSWRDCHWSHALSQRRFPGRRARSNIRGSYRRKATVVDGKLRIVSVDLGGRIVCYVPVCLESDEPGEDQ